MRIFFISMSIAFFHPSFAQDKITRNNIYFEAGGAAFFYSINYERLFLRNPRHNLAVRLGATVLSLSRKTERLIHGLPIGISYLAKAKKKYFEAGVSVAGLRDRYYPDSNLGVSDELSEELILIPSVRFGFRSQPAEKNLFWNILFQTSIISANEFHRYSYKDSERYVTPFISVGVGYAFH